MQIWCVFKCLFLVTRRVFITSLESVRNFWDSENLLGFFKIFKDFQAFLEIFHGFLGYFNTRTVKSKEFWSIKTGDTRVKGLSDSKMRDRLNQTEPLCKVKEKICIIHRTAKEKIEIVPDQTHEMMHVIVALATEIQIYRPL